MFLDRIQCLPRVVFAALCFASTGLTAQEAQEVQEPPLVDAHTAPADVEAPNNAPVEPIPSGPAPTETTELSGGDGGSDPCAAQSELRAWIDKLHSSLYRFSCSSVSWFDGLFGSRPFDDEYRATHGTITAGGQWSEREGFDQTLRFRARVYFPQISSQFNAFIGRADRGDFVDDSQTQVFKLPSQFSSGLDDQVFVGLGYNEAMKKRGSFDLDAGVRISDPIDPYVKGSYRFSRPLGESDLLRLRETLFWQQREGFGVSTLVEWSHVFDRDNLLRWTNTGLFSENSVGMRWYSDLYLYHLISADRAVALELLANGSTRLEVPLTTYGTAVIFRQRVWRKWLFLELRAGVDWPSYFLYDERRPNPNGALTLEMRFGQE